MKEFDADVKVKEVIAIYDQLNIRTLTETLANEYITAASKLLGKVTAQKERKRELTLLASSLIGRDK